MNETAVHDLLRQAMTGEEPPIANDLVAGAVRAARKARRRRLAAVIVPAAAIVPALAFGVPAVAHTLVPAAPVQHGIALSPGAAGSGQAKHVGKAHATKKSQGQAAQSHASPPANSYIPIRPVLPAGRSEVDPVPITSQSVGQLLIDDLPAGAHLNQLMANADASAGDPTSVGQLAVAEFNDVTTAFGSGSVQANLLHYTTGFFGQVCPTTNAQGERCVIYHLAGGVEVAEDVSTDDSGLQQLDVTVFRPGIANIDISEINAAMAAGSPQSAHMPLTMAQIVAVALDPRWGFTMSQSFVQQASGLQVGPLPSS